MKDKIETEKRLCLRRTYITEPIKTISYYIIVLNSSTYVVTIIVDLFIFYNRIIFPLKQNETINLKLCVGWVSQRGSKL